MMWKSLKEEWPYTNDEIWLRWTEDGATWREEKVHESKIPSIYSIDIPEWRPLDPPEWMSSSQKDVFDKTHGSWTNRVMEAHGLENPM